MAEEPDAAVQAKPRAHLSDLFRAGKQLTITDSNDVEYVLWMQRPTATQQEDAREAANVKSLRLKMQYKERDGDRYLVLHQTMEEMEEHDELVETRAKYKDGDIRNQAFNEVLYSEDHGEDWKKEDRYLSLLGAITDRWDEINRYNEQMEEAESDERITPTEDEQLLELLDQQNKFGDQVQVRTDELMEEEKARHVNKPDAQLRNEIVKESIDVESRVYWYETHQIRMLYYACRRTEDHDKFYFDVAEDVLNLPSHIRQDLYNAYDELERGSEDVKNSLSLPSSSVSSES